MTSRVKEVAYREDWSIQIYRAPYETLCMNWFSTQKAIFSPDHWNHVASVFHQSIDLEKAVV